ncbi:hypothetical protein AMTR_s00041p00237070 [Amborella trichopoda]|uniref:BURP domain-containing protein n=1 Tax=Amborella trichopoda TaxID=13333 RepID=W1PU50_AMBTC|nr:hypothetical protein AMTR_s00041p00237070 [Amborella trichopoda]
MSPTGSTDLHSFVKCYMQERLSHYHVAATPERYWAQAFPNTRIPDVIGSRFRPVPSELLRMGSGNRDPRFFYSDFSKENHDPRETTLFLEKDLKLGMNKILYFRKSEFSCASPFLSREDADAIPFSSAELPHILQRFSFSPASSEAVEVGVTLKWTITLHCSTLASARLLSSKLILQQTCRECLLSQAPQGAITCLILMLCTIATL